MVMLAVVACALPVRGGAVAWEIAAPGAAPSGTQSLTPTALPTCAPTLGITTCCATHCVPCPTIRAGCNARPCRDCIENPVCRPEEICVPLNPANPGCCSCATATGSVKMSSPTPTPEQSPATSSATPAVLVGDCNLDGCVRVNEVLTAVAITLGIRPFSDCPNILSFCGLPHQPPIICLIDAVNNVLTVDCDRRAARACCFEALTGFVRAASMPLSIQRRPQRCKCGKCSPRMTAAHTPLVIDGILGSLAPVGHRGPSWRTVALCYRNADCGWLGIRGEERRRDRGAVVQVADDVEGVSRAGWRSPPVVGGFSVVPLTLVTPQCEVLPAKAFFWRSELGS